MSMKKTGLIMLLAVLFAGCQKSKVIRLENKLIDGPWTGNVFEGQHVEAAIRLDFTQDGQALSGTFQIDTSSGIASGTLTGTYKGTEIDFALIQDAPCAGTYEIRGETSGGVMPMVLEGDSGCFDSFPSLTGTLYAEQPTRHF